MVGCGFAIWPNKHFAIDYAVFGGLKRLFRAHIYTHKGTFRSLTLAHCESNTQNESK